MRNFWKVLAEMWPDGTRAYHHWHVLPVDVRRFAYTYQELTHRAGLSPVPPNLLHMTIYRSIAVEDIHHNEDAKVTEIIRATLAHWTPMQLTFGPAYVSRSGILLKVTPEGPGSMLNGAVVAANVAVYGNRVIRPPFSPFWSHMSLAYGNDDIDATPLQQWLDDHPTDAITITVDRIHLVSQTYDSAGFRWDVVDEVPLG